MENYKVKRLTYEDGKALSFIAKTHEELPAAWIDNYHVSAETIISTTEDLVAKHNTQDIYCSVIEQDNKVISFIWAEVNKGDSKQIDIISLWTDEKFRGLGLAKNLKLDLEKWAIDEMNAEKVYTTVSSKNDNMIKLNEKLGYQIHYYRMVKNLV